MFKFIGAVGLALAMGIPLQAVAGQEAVPEAAQDLGKGIFIHLEQEVEAPAEATWGVLAHDFIRVDAWSSTVEASWEMEAFDVPDGYVVDADAPVIGRMVRSGIGEVSETLVMYDEDGKTFTFRAGGLPGFAAYSQNTQQVIDLGDGRSQIVFDIYFVPDGFARLMRRSMEKRFDKTMGMVLAEAAAYIETGEVSANSAMLAED